ncbi:UNVERIFIED_CONTAM: hypothetical protein GTU68_012529 [Idotea baltica]|nr:hypothetical protein [Idotea baltica]
MSLLQDIPTAKDLPIPILGLARNAHARCGITSSAREFPMAR